MKTTRITFLIIICLLCITSCSKRALKDELIDELIEVRTDTASLQTAVIEPESSYNDDFEAINSYAYNHYIQALLLESENPPDIPAAAEHYKRALQSYPNSYELRYSLANSYMSMRKFPETIELLSIIYPVDKKVLKMQGSAFLQVGKQDSAKYIFEKLVQVDPNEPTSYHYLSGFYRHGNNSDSLMWAYENLARLLPFNHKYWLELGKLKTQKGKYKAAKKDFQKSLEKNSSATNILSFIGLAEMYKFEKKFDSALIIYNQALSVDSSNVPLYTDITMMYAQLDSLEQAIPYAEKVVELAPSDVQARRRLGIIYFSTHKFDLAETVFTDLANTGEQNYLNHFYLGRIAAQREDYNIAVDEFKIMVQLNDSIPEHWLDLGYAYKKLGDSPHEILTYKTGATKVKNEKYRIKLLFSLGAAYEHGKMPDSAIAIFENILTLDPINHQAMNYLGYMLIEREENLSYAKRLIEKAMKLSPNNGAYIDSYGWLLFKMKKFKKAVKQLKIAAEIQEDAVIYEHLGDAYYARGEIKDAMDWWAKALQLKPDNEVIKNKLNNE